MDNIRISINRFQYYTFYSIISRLVVTFIISTNVFYRLRGLVYTDYYINIMIGRFMMKWLI